MGKHSCICKKYRSILHILPRRLATPLKSTVRHPKLLGSSSIGMARENPEPHRGVKHIHGSCTVTPAQALLCLIYVDHYRTPEGSKQNHEGHDPSTNWSPHDHPTCPPSPTSQAIVRTPNKGPTASTYMPYPIRYTQSSDDQD